MHMYKLRKVLQFSFIGTIIQPHLALRYLKILFPNYYLCLLYDGEKGELGDCAIWTGTLP